jgi:multimeric flavodoxin WrbA
MKAIAINGSARKGWNTHTLLSKALEGAASKGAQTEMVNLYELDYKGCIGCLGCKRKGGVVGRCALRDGLTPVLDSIHECDALFLGSPIYIGEVTGELRSFYERLVFQYLSYNKERTPGFTRKIKTGFIFTTNCPENMYETVGYIKKYEEYSRFMSMMFGECKTLAVGETWQTEDYDKFHMTMFDVPDRRRIREEVFPKQCEQAFELGAWACEPTE